jgi:hypothetical protein
MLIRLAEDLACRIFVRGLWPSPRYYYFVSTGPRCCRCIHHSRRLKSPLRGAQDCCSPGMTVVATRRSSRVHALGRPLRTKSRVERTCGTVVRCRLSVAFMQSAPSDKAMSVRPRPDLGADQPRAGPGASAGPGSGLSCAGAAAGLPPMGLGGGIIVGVPCRTETLLALPTHSTLPCQPRSCSGRFDVVNRATSYFAVPAEHGIPRPVRASPVPRSVGHVPRSSA